MTRSYRSIAALAGVALLLPVALGRAGQEARARIVARSRIIAGEPAGIVIVNGEEVIVLRSALGGSSPVERAQIVARRLQELDRQGRLTPAAVDSGTIDGTAVLLVDGVPVVTADSRVARDLGITPLQLAARWENNLRIALRGGDVPEPNGSPIATKIVPILSVGTGLRVGVAQVTGERERLDNTRAVAQVELTFRRVVRARVLVPISTTSGLRDLDRVPGVAVTGIGDIRL